MCLTAIILTKNEERHIARCIKSLEGVASQVVVIDSFSTDATTDIAAQLGATVRQHRWTNYATQFNWALDTVPLDGEWCLRIDADEYLTPGLRMAIQRALMHTPPPGDVSGYYINRAIRFSGHFIKWGGCYPIPMLRLFRRGVGRCEQRWMDEHIVLRHGRTRRLQGDLVDDNLNNLGWWTAKHAGYAVREAIDLLRLRDSPRHTAALHLCSVEGSKRFLKEVIYARLPKEFRAGIYFTYRYFVRLGFLDGRRGLTFHLLQGFWYRLLVDAIIDEISRNAILSGERWQDEVLRQYGHLVDQETVDSASEASS